MGSPCELLSESSSAKDAMVLTKRVAEEAWRVEDKFSRYIRGNIVDRLNSAEGVSVEVDEETAQLLDFATTLYFLSDGAFDITSGVLRRVWTFDGSDNVPSQDAISAVMNWLGWDKVEWRSPFFLMPAEMEIDLGGIGKEYAVDRAILELRNLTDVACLVNFGGDLAVTGPPQKRGAWIVGIEGSNTQCREKSIELRHGALATSGDARRFLLQRGVRYGHLLDPRTGWSVVDAAESVTVAAETCTQAGMLATLAMLKGASAEAFLESQAERFWCRRSSIDI